MATLIFRWMIRLYLYTRYFFEKLTRTGGFRPGVAAYLQEPYTPSGNRLKDLLYKYHVKQFHESSCSVASVASIINALMARQGNLLRQPVTQQELLDRVRVAHWKERMGDNGYKGKRGLPLKILGQVVKASLEKYGISYRSVAVVPVHGSDRYSHQMKKELKNRLERFENIGDCLLISHFNQGRYLPEFHIPHISPVGGFDSRSGQVTMLDVDPEQHQPYQISFDVFFSGLSCNYHHIFKSFGYGGGGYVYIRL